MQRCDFASVMAIIRGDLIEGAFSNQMDFVDKLFASVINEEGIFFDQGLVNKWFNGLVKVSPQVCHFYAVDEDGTMYLAKDIEKAVIPYLSDQAMAVQRVSDLVARDPSICLRRMFLFIICPQIVSFQFRFVRYDELTNKRIIGIIPAPSAMRRCEYRRTRERSRSPAASAAKNSRGRPGVRICRRQYRRPHIGGEAAVSGCILRPLLEIGRRSGQTAWLSLTYDLAFLVLLLSSLYEPRETEKNGILCRSSE